MDELKRHVITRVTEDGLVIELFDIAGYPLFDEHSDQPMPVLAQLVAVIADATKIVTNKISVAAHVRANPIIARDNPVWDKSAQRANNLRLLLEDQQVDGARIEKVTGYADRKPASENPMEIRNNRVEITLLR